LNRRALPALQEEVDPPARPAPKARGLFRWPGGKRHTIDRVKPLIQHHRGATGGRLISLFAGSLAIERACGGAAVAADLSPELLNLYDTLQRFGPETVHQALLDLNARTPRTKESAKAVGLAGMSGSPLLDAARFLWLSAMIFNGVWRVNRAGQMNMGLDPARLARADVLPPLEAFTSFAAEIARTKFVVGWEAALREAQPGDVLLVDPPYGDFVGYTRHGFTTKDQRLLAGELHNACTYGCAVITFNAPGAESLYLHWAEVEELHRAGNVSSNAAGRDKVAELLITAGLRQHQRPTQEA
jgi:DNA adenine methylase